MQGTIQNPARQNGQGVIVGDDGVNYTYTLLGWRDDTTGALPGMKVDFDVRGSHAVAVYPVPGAPLAQGYATPQTQPAQPIATFPGTPAAPQQPVQPPPAFPTVPAQPPASLTGAPVPPQPPAPPPSVPTAPAAAAPQHQVQPAPGVTVTVQQPGVPEPPKKSAIDVGGVIAGIAWMFLLSAFLSMFLPILGPMIGGCVGGRQSGSFANAALAALVSAVLVGGTTFLIAELIKSLLNSVPIIGPIIVGALGDLFTSGVVILALLNAFPMLIFALIGGASAKGKS